MINIERCWLWASRRIRLFNLLLAAKVFLFRGSLPAFCEERYNGEEKLAFAVSLLQRFRIVFELLDYVAVKRSTTFITVPEEVTHRAV